MGGTVNINGEFWHQAEDGSWFRYDTATSSWQPSAEAPPPPAEAVDPPRPPSPSVVRPAEPTAEADTTGDAGAVADPLRDVAVSPPEPTQLTKLIDTLETAAQRITPRGLWIASAVVAVILFGLLISSLITVGDDEDPVAVRPVPLPSPTLTGPVSPHGERNVYALARRVKDCFGPETLAWSGELRAGVLDRRGLEDDIRRISLNLQEVRSRRFPGPVDIKIVPRARVSKLAGRLAAAELTTDEAEIEARILIALGVLPPGTDLDKIGRDLIDDSIAGFYVPTTKKLYAGIGPAGFEAFDEVVLAHELDHALTDATIGLPPVTTEDRMEDDMVTAHRTAIEGDATLAMYHYAVASFNPKKWRDWIGDPSAAGSLDTSRVPGVLERAVTFPYFEGMLFACDQFSRGEWKDVDRSLRKPPFTTAQILFPDRYLRRTPVVDAPDPVAPAGWEEVRASSFGAADLLWMIQTANGTTKPGAGIDAVRGWAGGELHAWQRGEDIAVQITLVDGGVETASGSVHYQLCSTLESWYVKQFDNAKVVEGGFGWRHGRSFAAIDCSDNTPSLAIAPDSDTASALVAAP